MKRITNERNRKATSERNFGMSKYIIKNCPCVKHSDEIELDNGCMSTQDDKLFFCENNTDYIMKQIVEKCKKEIKIYRNTLLPNDGTNTLHFGRQSFAYDILQLLDIEEVE